jgi:hypothetical protein
MHKILLVIYDILNNIKLKRYIYIYIYREREGHLSGSHYMTLEDNDKNIQRRPWRAAKTSTANGINELSSTANKPLANPRPWQNGPCSESLTLSFVRDFK